MEFIKYRGHRSKYIDYFYISDASNPINLLKLAVVVGKGDVLIKAIPVIQANFNFFRLCFAKCLVLARGQQYTFIICCYKQALSEAFYLLKTALFTGPYSSPSIPGLWTMVCPLSLPQGGLQAHIVQAYTRPVASYQDSYQGPS